MLSCITDCTTPDQYAQLSVIDNIDLECIVAPQHKADVHICS